VLAKLVSRYIRIVEARSSNLLHSTMLIGLLQSSSSPILLEQITPSWRTKQRRIFVSGKGQRRTPAVQDEANRQPNEPRKFQVSHASVEIDYGELRLVNAGVAALC
jgi:hypothetical protein